MIIVPGAIVLVAGGMDDWYCIERAEHDGHQWMEQVSANGYVFRRSARVSDADVEGTGEQMLSLARAVLDGGGESHKRCAVRALANDSFAFRSPRNSRAEAVVSGDHARAWARDVINRLGTPELEGGN